LDTEGASLEYIRWKNLRGFDDSIGASAWQTDAPAFVAKQPDHRLRIDLIRQGRVGEQIAGGEHAQPRHQMFTSEIRSTWEGVQTTFQPGSKCLAQGRLR
jgi:hypothetical protein